MNIEVPDTATLILLIPRQTVSVVCDDKRGVVHVVIPDSGNEYDLDTHLIGCPSCHGTGRREVEVEGWVGVDKKRFGDCEHDYNLYIVDPGRENYYYIIHADDTDKAISELLAAYADGTLPEAVRRGIREVDNET